MLGNADAITVIRAGRTVGEVDDPSTVTARQLAEMMVGSELPSPETRERRSVTDVRARASSGLTVMPGGGAPALLDDVSFAVHAARSSASPASRATARPSSSRRSWASAPAPSGTIELGGDDVGGRRRRATGAAAASATSPRTASADGMVLPFPLWENVLLGHQSRRRSRNGLVDRPQGGRRSAPSEIVAEFDVRTPGIEVPAFTLSGGNQQKLIVGREMTREPKVLSPPTRPAASTSAPRR